MRKLKCDWNVPELQILYTPIKSQIVLDTTVKAARYLRSIWDSTSIELQESFYVLFLKPSYELIAWRCLNIGSANTCVIDIKLLVQLSLKCNAEYVVVAHNHPGGGLLPSDADIKSTKAIVTALNMVGIFLDDHFILNQNNYFSFDSNKLLNSFDKQIAVHEVD